jgi:hypothetical protein
MPSSSRARTRLEELATVVVIAAAGVGLILTWRGRQLNLRPWWEQLPFPLAWVERQGRAQGDRPLATAIPPADTQAPLTIPPPVIPNPLPPHEAWPELPVQEAGDSFTDLPQDHWVAPVVYDLASRQLLSGFPDGSFRPAAAMTRAEFAAQLARLFDFPQPTEVGAYTDVGLDHWATSAIQKSVDMRFLSGYPNDTFQPDQAVTRIHVIVALANGLALRSSRGAAAVLAPFDDREEVPPWALAPLVAALDADLVVNYPDQEQLEPNRLATRAEVTAMLHRALVYTGHLQAVPLSIGGMP